MEQLLPVGEYPLLMVLSTLHMVFAFLVQVNGTELPSHGKVIGSCQVWMFIYTETLPHL
jgi:hypothetical protein